MKVYKCYKSKQWNTMLQSQYDHWSCQNHILLWVLDAFLSFIQQGKRLLKHALGKAALRSVLSTVIFHEGTYWNYYVHNFFEIHDGCQQLRKGTVTWKILYTYDNLEHQQRQNKTKLDWLKTRKVKCPSVHRSQFNWTLNKK